MKQVRLLLLISVLLLAFLPNAAASAHKPIWGEENGTITIPNLKTSYAFYRNLTEEKVDVYSFEGKAGQQIHVGMEIPAVKGLEDYSVTLALMGPGLPEADHASLPEEHPEDLGALIVPSTTSEDFFEPFTQTLYWGRQSLDTTLPADGTYYILVWQSDGRAGKYVMDSGYAEEFGLSDFFRFPIWWLQVHLFFNHGVYLVVAAFLLIGLFLFLRKRGAK